MEHKKEKMASLPGILFKNKSEEMIGDQDWFYKSKIGIVPELTFDDMRSVKAIGYNLFHVFHTK